MSRKKVTIMDLQQAKKDGRKLVMLTAYDYPFGQIMDLAEVDIVLVGDSLGMVVMGLDGTSQVTMDEMIHHIKAVMRGCKSAFVVGDMPFMSYNTSIRDAVINAGRLMKEGGCDCVKLEGGVDFAPTVEAIVKAGIPVQGHIGLTPQTASALGGFKAQGRNAESAYQIIEDAKALEAAGCFSLIVEAVPHKVSKIIAETVKIPVIGIGAGPDVDGQVLVTHDMLGLFDKFTPRFVRKYAQIRPFILDALKNYRTEVMEGTFPGPENSFTISDEALEQVKARLKD
ncbi:3-methyl-2-oxobutanoate hydroxymethyltransferase [Dethiosulfatarculus sandiegensis]|uniref:3-methyl-2-oxobutanoate hydroxymethyltransferase n=1 Tax=Dethiosulfatarculus sandiegensis TaxID=1429043 RepID=A0A0D2JBS1_9BACT|nr:3-methyl-2-oxobutanoate hydroxymethyltransferase [Dethiosulfatarculus sandiegensis]KIX15589.1 3-methyl-2-oxobutanoate hydroxymethyltransferase [Dethiosulfatarculus sandiegensis]